MNQLRHTPKLAAAAGQYDAARRQIGNEIGRRLLQHRENFFDDLICTAAENSVKFGRRQRDLTRQSRLEIAPLAGHRQFHGTLHHAADADFDLLRRRARYKNFVVLADVGDDRLVERVAADADRPRRRHAAGGDHGAVGDAAAEVDDHLAGNGSHVQLCAERRRQRSLDQVRTPRAGFQRGLDHGAFLDLGDAGRHGDDRTRLDERVADDLANESGKQPFGHVVVGHGAALHRAHRLDVAGRAAHHVPRLRANAKHLTVVFVDGNDRRLTQNDALAVREDHHVRRAEINAQITK